MDWSACCNLSPEYHWLCSSRKDCCWGIVGGTGKKWPEENCGTSQQENVGTSKMKPRRFPVSSHLLLVQIFKPCCSDSNTPVFQKQCSLGLHLCVPKQWYLQAGFFHLHWTDDIDPYVCKIWAIFTLTGASVCIWGMQMLFPIFRFYTVYILLPKNKEGEWNIVCSTFWHI